MERPLPQLPEYPKEEIEETEKSAAEELMEKLDNVTSFRLELGSDCRKNQLFKNEACYGSIIG